MQRPAGALGAPISNPIATAAAGSCVAGTGTRVTDISRSVTVSDFRLVRQSNILAVIHKATEGGDYADAGVPRPRPLCRRWPRRRAGCRWSTCIRPGPNGDPPALTPALSLGARITPDSILALCSLWVADYHDSPEGPRWPGAARRLAALASMLATRGAGRPRLWPRPASCGVCQPLRSQTCSTADAAALHRFWMRSRLSYCVIPKAEQGSRRSWISRPSWWPLIQGTVLSLMEANSFARSTK